MTAGDRWVVLGLAQARSPWFARLGQWAHSAALPVEFVKCVSADELRARLGAGRPYSALVVDAGLPAVDRDLLAAAADAGCVVLVVDDRRVRRDWPALGAAAVLGADFGRDELLSALGQHARPISSARALPGDGSPEVGSARWRGRVVAVTGPGGTGASTAAIALAQGLAADARLGGNVLLADLRLHAEQAMLHDTRDVVPGVEELVEAHRRGRPGREEVRGLTFAVAERGYSLLLGLRRATHWPAIRPAAFAAAFESLSRAFQVVVADVDRDLDGEAETGSSDVEDRHTMARTAVASADVVVAVGEPSMKGLHSLAALLHDLDRHGVAAARVLPVLNRAPRSPRSRAGLASALAELARRHGGASPVFLPERRVDEALRDGVRLPDAVVVPLVGGVRAVLDRGGERASSPAAPEPVAVRPGELGHWSEEAG